MTRRREDLDEVIDRVAAAMTFAPADAALAARVADQVNRDRAASVSSWARATAALAATAVVVATVSLARFSRPNESMPTATPTPTLETVLPLVELAVSVPAATLPASGVRFPRRTADASRDGMVLESSSVPQIPALQSPDLLTLDTLRTTPLTIAPVDSAPLELPELEVEELAVRHDSKE